MYPVLHSTIERGSNKKAAAAGLKIPLRQHKKHKQHECQKCHPKFQVVIPIIRAHCIKCGILVNTGHAQYLGKWYYPIKMIDVTDNQWISIQKALRIAKKQQLE